MTAPATGSTPYWSRIIAASEWRARKVRELARANRCEVCGRGMVCGQQGRHFVCRGGAGDGR